MSEAFDLRTEARDDPIALTPAELAMSKDEWDVYVDTKEGAAAEARLRAAMRASQGPAAEGLLWEIAYSITDALGDFARDQRQTIAALEARITELEDLLTRPS